MKTNLKNNNYVICIGTNNFTEKYYKDKNGWLKISARGNKLYMTAEQVLNHILPVLAGIKPNLMVRVEYKDQSKPRVANRAKECAAKPW
ncbi:hypothetical protein M1615_00560 [Patescibacteria group bacterium]|nr:hypothetical protein [Patescibacteria group bacterium]MCL5010223.1 hypothetical protein [Patescibacteria group bacterium]